MLVATPAGGGYGTEMEANRSGAARNGESRAPCQPRSCHLPILSLHVNFLPELSIAQRHISSAADMQRTSPLRCARHEHEPDASARKVAQPCRRHSAIGHARAEPRCRLSRRNQGAHARLQHMDSVGGPLPGLRRRQPTRCTLASTSEAVGTPNTACSDRSNAAAAAWLELATLQSGLAPVRRPVIGCDAPVQAAGSQSWLICASAAPACWPAQGAAAGDTALCAHAACALRTMLASPHGGCEATRWKA
jgi:hypothetical protein